MKRILSLLASVACLCGGEVAAQETVEIRYTIQGVVSHTVEVDRDIERLNLSDKDLTSFTLSEGLTSLETLDLSENQLTSFTLPEGLTSLRSLYLSDNELTNVTLPEGLTNLTGLYLSKNQLTSFALPGGSTNLTELRFSENQLTNFVLPEGLTNLKRLYLFGNQLTNLTLPKGLTSLQWLDLTDNQLTSLTLAEDTAERFLGIDTGRGLAYNLRVRYGHELKVILKVILPKRLNGKVFFADTGNAQFEFLFLEDARSPRITRAGDALEITWSVGVLQTSAGIEGPWKDVNASSPLRIFPRPSLPAEFFRVRAE